MELLRMLATLRNPVLDRIMLWFSYAGDELVFMVLALILIWCISKEKGYFILFAGFFGMELNQFLKLLFRVPRPWVLDPDFSAVEIALKTAPGYSFPSGHSQNAVILFGGLARICKRTWLRVVFVLLAALIVFSRMYLGVHTPLDVGVAVLISVVLLLIMYPLTERSVQNARYMYGLLGVMFVLSVAYLLFLYLYPFSAELDAGNYKDGLKNGYSLLGALLGFLPGYILDRRKLHYDVSAPLLGQILKVVLGLGAALAVKEGSKYLFSLLFGASAAINLFRYALLVFFICAVWPLTFPFFQKISFSKKQP